MIVAFLSMLYTKYNVFRQGKRTGAGLKRQKTKKARELNQLLAPWLWVYLDFVLGQGTFPWPILEAMQWSVFFICIGIINAPKIARYKSRFSMHARENLANQSVIRYRIVESDEIIPWLERLGMGSRG